MVDNYRVILPHIKDQFTDAVKVFVHHERPYEKTRKEKIRDLNTLQAGDHVSFYKNDLYYAHHAIVSEARTDYLRVIHYFNTAHNMLATITKGSIYIAEVIECEMPVNLTDTSEDLYLHHYDGIQCFSNEETLQRAFSELGKRGYSLLGNNCEHWARWCRTGEHFSEQVYKFRRYMQKRSATLLIIDPAALFIKDVALVGASSFGQFLSAAGSGVILTAVEGITAYIDIKKKKNENKKGDLSDVALKKYIVMRISSASGTVVGGTAGTVVGTILIPVPILGATVGGVVGSISGKIVGGIAGIALSKIIEVHVKRKQAKIKQMTAIPQLMNKLSPEGDIVRGLMAITMDYEEEEKISNVIDEAINSETSSIYPSLEEFIDENSNATPEVCQAVRKLSTELFTDSDSFDYFVLKPVPDENAPEEFASSIDSLVLRWPMGTMKPWESTGEHVLDINELHANKE